MTKTYQDIWLINLNNSKLQAMDHSILDSIEAARAARFKYDQHRQRFIASHIAMRMILAKYLETQPQNLTYAKEINGKPYLQYHPELKFNLSHSGDYAMVAVSDQPIGVDIEKISDRDELDLAKRFFSTAEYAWLIQQSADKQQAAFFQLWSRKESVIKLTGLGLKQSLSEFSVINDQIDLDDKKCHIKTIDSPDGYTGAVASYQSIETNHREF